MQTSIDLVKEGLWAKVAFAGERERERERSLVRKRSEAGHVVIVNGERN